ncbi:conserved Plasmodium protein, unknown function [Plasmodium ovale wallikeri]|uniref:Uncharacterized protein n=2 Tax=Plasmodium ovale TaxID=36330 RepID=A0A1A8ZNU5_PLAOA|nr:conserved Plasmodium protein, unknown function [Plasmodium ovale wallikeri]SBT57818.1 conserved Plasmodium protein, unknown function [Plasmodium ovale wallikeri]SBT78854.1 conserved Plasmodium protein, unknown function [Plasmodium ovale]
MDNQRHFRHMFMYAEEGDWEREKEDLYVAYIGRCFSHMLNQNDDYILATLKKNGSLISFFFSHLLKGKRVYDICVSDLVENTFSPIDKYILDFYLRLIKIFLNKDRNETSIIKSTFLKIHIFVDILMMYNNMRKKQIKNLLNQMYKNTKLYFFNIDKYISFLYEQLINLKGNIEKYVHNKNNSTNLLFQINEYTICIYCFIKFFKKYYHFDLAKNELSNDLIIFKLLSYSSARENTNVVSSSSSSSPHMLEKSNCSFSRQFVHTYFEMMRNLYCGNQKDGMKKDVLFLRYRFAKILKMCIKYNLKYGKEKNKLLFLSTVIDLLKEQSNDLTFLLLRNDIKLSRWNFLTNFVLQNKLDFEFYMYVNNFLKLNSQKRINKILKKKYEQEINQIKEIASWNNSAAILKILQKNNFHVANTLEEILSTVRPDSVGGSNSNGEIDGSSDSGFDGSDVSNGNSGSYDVNSGGDEDKVCWNNLSGGDDDVGEEDWSDGGRHAGLEQDTCHAQERGRKNILQVLRERELEKKANKKKSSKCKYTNESLDSGSKNIILNQLNYESSSSEDSSGEFENDVIIPTSYRRNCMHGGDGGGDGGEDEENAENGDNRGNGGNPLSCRHGRGGKKEGHEHGYAHAHAQRGRFSPHAAANRARGGTKGRENLDSPKKKGTPKDDNDNSVEKEKAKRYYMRKTVNKGRSHRNQFDRKMSRGMF